MSSAQRPVRDTLVWAGLARSAPRVAAKAAAGACPGACRAQYGRSAAIALPGRAPADRARRQSAR